MRMLERFCRIGPSTGWSAANTLWRTVSAPSP